MWGKEMLVDDARSRQASQSLAGNSGEQGMCCANTAASSPASGLQDKQQLLSEPHARRHAITITLTSTHNGLKHPEDQALLLLGAPPAGLQLLLTCKSISSSLQLCIAAACYV
jgi:hypothetical protein